MSGLRIPAALVITFSVALAPLLGGIGQCDEGAVEDGAAPAPPLGSDRQGASPDRSLGTRDAASWPRFHGDVLNTGFSTARAPRSPDLLWEFATGGEVYGSPTVADGRVYFTSFDEKLYCLNLETGGKLWEYKLAEKTYCSPAVAGGMVYAGVGTDTDHGAAMVVALEADTGEEVWVFETGGSVLGSPVVSDEMLYFGDEWGTFYAVDARGNADGTTGLKWTVETGFQVWSTPAFKGQDLLFTGGNSRLYKVNKETGTIKLNASTPPGDFGIFSSPAVEGKRVYVGSAKTPEGQLLCMDYDTGQEIWNFSTLADQYGVSSTPAIHDGVVFAGSNNGRMYAVDAQTGKEKWNFATGDTFDGIYSSAAVADGLVFFGSADAKFYAVDEQTGQVAWSFATAEKGLYGVVSSPAVVEDKVLVGGSDKKLYCFGKAAPPAFGLTAEVMELGSYPVQTVLRAEAATLDGSPLQGVAVEVTGERLTFASATGATGEDGVFTSDLTAEDVDVETVVEIHVTGRLEGYLDQEVFLNHTLLPRKIAPLNLTITPADPAVQQGEIIEFGLLVEAEGAPVNGSRITPTFLEGRGGRTYFTAASTRTLGDGRASLRLNVTADQPDGVITISFKATADGFNGTEVMVNVTVGAGDEDGGTGDGGGSDGGGDGGDGEDGTDGAGTDGGDLEGDGSIEEEGMRRSTLAGLVAVVVVALAIVVSMLISRLGRGRE